MKRLSTLLPRATFSPGGLFLVTTLVAFLYVLMEWVFIVTKPSFLQQAAFGSRLLVLFSASALLAALATLLCLPFTLAFKRSPAGRVTSALRSLSAAVPALLLSALVLMMADNFTYTVFGFGIVSAKGGVRALYLIPFLLLTAWLYTRTIALLNFTQEALENRPPRVRKVTLGILAALIVLLAAVPALAYAPYWSGTSSVAKPSSAAHFPNILLITADSLNANRMSVYGYEKPTTPFLEELAKSSLVAQNAFSNAQGTIGSLTSILTGRYPVDTGVLTTNDILRDEAATQHMPGILRKYGYYSVQLSYSYYADARRLNFQGGFDEANGTRLNANPLFSALSAVFPSNISYFTSEITARLLDRLAHIFFLRDMNNPYLQVTESPEKFNDQQKLEYALALFDRVDQPLFIHIHWMGTHGPAYHPANQVFSAGEDPEKQGKFDEDFYLDSILEFDQSLAALYAALQERGALENTVLVIAADHSQRWNIIRLPLLMRFPGGENIGLVRGNVQYLNIAPTLLDAVNIPKPAWMAGTSLLEDQPETSPIILTEIPAFVPDAQTGKRVFPEIRPPFYQFGKVSLITCDQWVKLEFASLKLTRGTIPDYAQRCSSPALSDREAIQLISEYLETYGLDASSLETMVEDQ